MATMFKCDEYTYPRTYVVIMSSTVLNISKIRLS